MAWHGDDDPAVDFPRLLDTHQRRIHRLALDLTGNHHDAEDLTQQTFLKAYQGRHRFRAEASPATWLRRIAVNTHIDGLRRPATRAASRSDDDPETRLAAVPTLHVVDDPERRTEAAAIQHHIARALARLSPRERAVFVLRHYHHLKLREIASTLDVTEGTVKSVLFRALRRLRDALAFYRPELGLEDQS